MTMSFGVMLPHFMEHASRDSITTVAQAAERLGFDSVWTTDHIAIVEELQPRFGTRVFEAVSTMAFVAGITERVRIGISSLVVPYRNAFIAAKAMTTVDVLSDGRLILGAVSGWCEPEFDALAVSHADRGRLTDEGLETITRLWRSQGKPIGHEGQQIVFEPWPVQRPRPPIWVGGNSRRGLQRALDFGDSWHLAPPSLPEVAWARDLLDVELQARSRPPDDVRLSIRLPLLVTDDDIGTDPGRHPRAELRDQRFSGDQLADVTLVGSADRITERLAAYRQHGVDYVVFDLFYSLPQLTGRPVSAMVETMEAFVETVLPALDR
jgi:probable F420-dependent oxidoreductase